MVIGIAFFSLRGQPENSYFPGYIIFICLECKLLQSNNFVSRATSMVSIVAALFCMYVVVFTWLTNGSFYRSYICPGSRAADLVSYLYLTPPERKLKGNFISRATKEGRSFPHIIEFHTARF